jgi:hypothetical protein
MKLIDESHVIILSLLLTSPLYHNATMLEVSFCGFEQTCSKNITKHVLPYTSCCKPCECDDVCAEKGTCCRDKKGLVDADIVAKQKCIPAVYTPTGAPVPDRIMYYFTRTKCPTAFNDMTIKAKCEGDMPETITDVIPVSSRDGKVMYKNKYCSFCHGERRTYNWDVSVHAVSSQTCRDIFRPESLDTFSIKILSNCILAFSQPFNVDYLKLLCFVDSSVVKHCNVTGKWEAYDSELDNLCLNQTGLL